MIRILTTVLCLLVGNTVVNAQCNPFYNPEENTKWEITNYDAKDKVVSRNVNEVKSVDSGADGWKAVINVKSYDKKDKLELDKDIAMECDDGVVTMDMSRFMPEETLKAFQDMDMKIETDNLEIPKDLEVGSTLKDASIRVTGNLPMTIETKIINRKVEAKESITTSAGTFECFKISYTIKTKTMMTMEFSGIDWIAEEVGMVKSESYRKNGKLQGVSVLTSYE